MGQQTCWKYWLKLKDTFCPCLDHLQDKAPKIEFVEPLGHSGQGVVMKVLIENKIYALKLVRLSPAYFLPFLLFTASCSQNQSVHFKEATLVAKEI